jgi:hypothetical protein
MKTFIFSDKNGNAIITLSAENYEKALSYLRDIVTYPLMWRVNNEEGEDE